MADDNIQHGIDDDPNNDPHKAKNIGGIGGAVTGVIAGAVAGPVGAVIGGVVGGVAGAYGSEAAVRAVDKRDNDDTVTGIGDGVTYKNETGYTGESRLHEAGAAIGGAYESAKEHIAEGYHNAVGTTRGAVEGVENRFEHRTAATGTGYASGADTSDQVAAATTPTGSANGVPGIQTGGVATDGTPDTRGITEKLADKLTGDHIDDKTGKTV